MIAVASFRPLIRGFFFYLKCLNLDRKLTLSGFRPLIRGFFFYLNGNAYTFYAFDSVSVPSFGDSFFIRKKEADKCCCTYGFRPLIRGFFFYDFLCRP